MKDGPRDVTQEYERAREAAVEFNPGAQPDIAKLMRTAYMHGYAKALLDEQDRRPHNSPGSP